MTAHNLQFMGEDAAASSYDKATVAVIPFPYEGGVSYGKGTSGGPDAIIYASSQVELYDEILFDEPYKTGIFTVPSPEMPDSAEGMIDLIYRSTKLLIEDGKFVVLFGGDHSISSGYARALKEKYGRLSVIQFDAHADLRDSYNGSQLSHASVMARVREITPDTLQIGIRSLCADEARLIKDESLQVCTMRNLRRGNFDLDSAIEMLPDPVFITFDVDAFDLSVIRSTGTPEPGGLTWDETMDILEKISKSKKVVGFDVVELSADENDNCSAFAAAKLAYRMIGLFKGSMPLR